MKYDETVFGSIVERSTQLAREYVERNKNADAVERMILMDWKDKPSDPNARIIVSPLPRNAVVGVLHLLTSTDPTFSVPYDKNDNETRSLSEKLERAAAALWYVNGHIHQYPLHHDIVYSAAAFGEVHIAVISSDDLVEYAKKGKLPKSSIRRYETIRKLTPFLFEVFDPRQCYAEYDRFGGLAAHFRKVRTTSGAIFDVWGSAAEESGVRTGNRYEEVDLCEWWDDANHVVWVDGSSVPLLFAEHELPCIPIVSQITQGSFIHNEVEKRVQPFLYGEMKSGLWEAMNVILTGNYTSLRSVGLNAQWVYQRNDPDKELFIDHSLLGGVVHIDKGEQLMPLAKQVIDPSSMTAYTLYERLSQDSTIYPQALGAPLSGQVAYSTVALLNQTGRLPLTTIVMRTGSALAKLMEMVFLLWKEKGRASVKGRSGVLTMASGEIPEDLVIDCKLDVSLPQDQRQNVLVAIQGVQSGLFSSRWARENILGIGQSDDMETEIFYEKLKEFELQRKLKEASMPPQVEIPQNNLTGEGLPAMPQAAPGTTLESPGEMIPPELMAIPEGGMAA